jgi:hypothetical protein
MRGEESCALTPLVRGEVRGDRAFNRLNKLASRRFD